MNKRNWAFNQGGHNWPSVIGMTEERSDEIIKTVRHELIDGDTLTAVAEVALNKLQPANEVEALFIGYVLGASHEKGRKPQNTLAALAKMFGE